MSGDVPYTASFIQLYKDNTRRDTDIEGIITQTSIENIHIVKGDPFYLETGLSAPLPPKLTPTPTSPSPPTTSLKERDEEYTQDSNKDDIKDYIGDEMLSSKSRLPATLYPPPEPTSPKPNPLRRFYPEEEEKKKEKDLVTAAKFLENVSSGKEKIVLNFGLITLVTSLRIRIF